MTASPGRRRLLFICEAVTLAHLARPIALSAAFSENDWVVALACDSRCRPFLDGFRGEHLEVKSIDPRSFLHALSRGAPVYDSTTLERYVRDDLRLIERFAPDVVVGDFRLSLSVSARTARIPYVALANAYWSPRYTPFKWTVPELPLTHALPIAAAQQIFNIARPIAFAMHCRPLNRVRRQHGLARLSTLQRIYTDADFVAYADAAELFPISGLPDTDRFIGPVFWEPSVPLPAWWDDMAGDRAVIYVTLGSSGQVSMLPRVIDALADLDATIVVATAGRVPLAELPANVRAADFLPGMRAAARASLVVCNGGSLTCYQALSLGVPVIGIASNLDQLLNIQAIERFGAGVMLRADRASVATIRAAATSVVDGCKAGSASRLAHILSRYEAPRQFVDVVARALETGPATRSTSKG